MGLVIGMDEAGYGPNLGPLVVTATAWEVPRDPHETDFWSQLDRVCHRCPPRGDDRLHVADSKQVYTPARGLAALEQSVLAACRLAGLPCDSFQALWHSLNGPATPDPEPWFDGRDLPLPNESHVKPPHELAAGWRDCCAEHGIRLRAVRSDIVLTRRFNRLTDEYGSKGVTLSRVSMNLLRSVWDPGADEPTLVIADKHGGRNRYDLLLQEVLDGQMIRRHEEGTDLSRYTVGRTELRFQTRAEAHFPVALASMVSKYVRELAMHLFNRFWSAHVPGLKPTAGYPTDAKRFRNDIAGAQQRLGIPDDQLWRAR